VSTTEDSIAKQLVDLAYRAHGTLGPVLLESVYEAVLAHELRKRCLTVLRQHAFRLSTRAPVSR